jgi:hypothetical protein
MREHTIHHPVFTYFFESARKALMSALRTNLRGPAREGGEPLPLSHPVKETFLERKEKSHACTPDLVMDSQNVSPLIRTADWVLARGQIRPISDVPTPEEQVGILFNVIRRRRHLTLERLARKTGYELEELLAFEAGLLPRRRVLEMLPELSRQTKFAYRELLHVLQPNTGNTPNP